MHFLRDIFGSYGRELDLLWIICKLKLTSIQMMTIYPFLYSSCLIPLRIGLNVAVYWLSILLNPGLEYFNLDF